MLGRSVQYDAQAALVQAPSSSCVALCRCASFRIRDAVRAARARVCCVALLRKASVLKKPATKRPASADVLPEAAKKKPASGKPAARWPTYDLTAYAKSVEMPEDALPQGPSRGQHNYTVMCPVNGEACKIEVQLQTKVFFLRRSIYGDLEPGTSPCYNWGKLGGIWYAWQAVAWDSGWKSKTAGAF